MGTGCAQIKRALAIGTPKREIHACRAHHLSQ
jgi:hypothetical protein